MTRARIALATFLLAPSLVVACTTTDVEADRSPEDAGVDVTPSPPSSEEDASLPEAGRPPVTPASRPKVECSAEPCYVAVSGNGGEHTCGLLKDGTVRCWGRDKSQGSTQPEGALGRGRSVSTLEGATPAPVVGLHDVTQISVGRTLGTCARTSDGSVYCWGKNDSGQLGRDPAEAVLPVPTRVEGLPPVSTVVLGGSTGCAIAAPGGASVEGELWCWGARDGVIGLAAADGGTRAFPPQRMTGFRPPVRELAIGTFALTGSRFDTIAALLGEGVLASLGELPAGETSVPPGFSPLPIEVPGIARIGVFAHLTTDGSLTRWAPNKRALYVPHPETVVDVALSARYVGGFPGPVRIEQQGGVLLSSGRLFRWGVNTSGELGYPPGALDIAEDPVEMKHLSNRVVSFSTTFASTCASLVDGKVECWGTNQQGELGRGVIDDELHPEAAVIE